MTILLKNGTIYDGSGKAPFVGDILVRDDTIIAVGPDLAADGGMEFEQTIDLTGLSVSSGFIDAHSHNDWFAIRKQPLPFFEPFIHQGITTFVTGNCGLSTTGFEPDSAFIDKIGGNLFFYNDVTGRYGSMDAFFNAIDGNSPCNIAALIGHCSARASIVGTENRPLLPEEETQMLAILEKALQQGACGISLGLMYEPGLYADTRELKEVAKLCLKYNRPLTVHPRANSAVSMAYNELFGRSHLLRALDELVDISTGTALKLHYSHAIFVGRTTLKDKKEFLEIMHRLRETGVDAMFDVYHEIMGVSVITVILPGWYQAMSTQEKKKFINKAKLNALITATSLLLGFGFDDIQIAFIGQDHKQYEGKTVQQIAREMGKSSLETYLYLCELSNFKGRINLSPYSTPEIISELSKDEQCLYMTDAWVEEYGVQNPAIFDCFPKFLKGAILGSGDTLPMTIRRMTGGTADRFGLAQRGYVQPGYFADLTVFNEEKLKVGEADRGKAFGIEKVFINGKLVLDGEQMNKDQLKTSGRAMRVK